MIMQALRKELRLQIRFKSTKQYVSEVRRARVNGWSSGGKTDALLHILFLDVKLLLDPLSASLHVFPSPRVQRGLPDAEPLACHGHQLLHSRPFTRLRRLSLSVSWFALTSVVGTLVALHQSRVFAPQ